ncbi:MAG: 3-hydroxyacyl-ACP dehydratase FabZ [Verrucomicrobia bacterium]|nr:3-hydroxyacyl-ACP dehydratase FabZ [Verrucomicrobiota bacterium]MCH8510232.1 3-hydroxyacyl-ACP dehydratase FabZ [Kiritimatiellia bacterium]
MAQYGIDEIMVTLPHRYPFLLVDRILETDGDTHIVGMKNVSANEPYFQGHFPNNPVMPGVLQLEAMAQVAGILLNKRNEREGQIAYFSSIDNARFRKVVRPGDTLIMEIELLKVRLNLAKVHATAKVNGETVSEGDLMFHIERN